MSNTKNRLLLSGGLVVLFFILGYLLYPAGFAEFMFVLGGIGIFYIIDQLVSFRSKRQRNMIFIVFFLLFFGLTFYFSYMSGQ
ncbi:hypothetical protein [Fictibacillus fluitans]|uniref:DUF3953 domain-containing protein n=1 Tax=Fictibacillus fluitans TaxID=3058422 RepID=A0ABT8HWQ5_9BACL|nr:hypothetical protein [Fictibacillus sp. NE201]MDN4525158.1 hypothetical protein [Fictibacillus sp. NE201]